MKDCFDYSYLKLEAIFETITEMKSQDITQDEFTNFFSKFVSNAEKNQQLYVIDITSCNSNTITKLTQTSKIVVLNSQPDIISINNIPCINVSENSNEYLEKLKMEVYE